MKRTLRVCMLGLALLMVACRGGSPPQQDSPNSPSQAATSASATDIPPVALPLPAKGSGTVQVLYAGSLVATIENGVGPAFSNALGYTYQGEAGGSVALANEIKDKLRQPDIFISADPSVNDSLAGAKNGDLADWYVVWGRTALVIAYNPRSRFAAQLDQAKAGTLPWYQVLKSPGFKLGRTDPELDPKGYKTIFMMDLAEKYYKQPGLRRAILGAGNNVDQVFPEQDLVARLQTGQLDAGVFYTSEVVDVKLPYITVPDEINQGNPQLASLYAQESFTDSKGNVDKGSPIVYTATVPSVAKNPTGGLAFIQYLGTTNGRALLTQHGILPSNLLSGGDTSKIPEQLKPYLKGAYQSGG